MSGYDDMIHMPYPQRPPRMPRIDRAAQFAPFAALTGYGEAVAETARITESDVQLGEDALAVLNEQLRTLEPGEMVTITYFRPDDRKAGGTNVCCTGRVRRVDAHRACLLMDDGTKIPFGKIRRIAK